VIRRAAIAAAVAVLAAGCGSDTGPAAPKAARPLRIALLDHSPDLTRGLRAAERYVGAVETADEPDADLVVTSDAGQAVQAANRSDDAHVLLLGPPPADPVPPNLLVVQISRGQPAYLAGALAALTGAETVAVAGGDEELAAAVRAGGQEAGAALRVVVTGCQVAASTDVVFAERPECVRAKGPAEVIAPQAIDGAHQLAVIGPRPWVAVAAAARAVQANSWTPGVMLEGLRQDVLGIGWISPAVPAGAVDRLQRIEDQVRAGRASVPVVAPVPQAG
jgi:hypothetical protein